MMSKHTAKGKARGAKVVPLPQPRQQSDDPAREKRITALVSIIAVAHQIARRQIAAERGYAA